jgi:uncharacterized hydrophobic protein (TIGR00271 family)
MLLALRRTFSLRRETDLVGTLDRVRSGVEFHSGNTWSLVCAIVIASIGLNVNSTAVIIGAMLISPLMGPIIGAGFGLATNDLPLLRRAVRNMLLAVVVGLVSSTVYFAVSPLQGPQSELLARVRPTLYDVLIAVFGGAAGVVAVTRTTNMGNVLPGVAIATALMPPLCTAGFGIANGSLWFFLGAFHLFAINALFICLATVALARVMGFERIVELDPARLFRARRAIVGLALVIGVPSVYTGWTVVQEARFQRAARQFVEDNLNVSDRAIVNVDLRYSRSAPTISATLLGQPMSDDMVRALEQRLSAYGLAGTTLTIRQPDKGLPSTQEVGQIVRQGILDDLYKHNEAALVARDARIRLLEDEVVRLRTGEFPIRELSKELSALYPALVSIGVGRELQASEASEGEPTVVAVASWRRLPTAQDQARLREFLAQRMHVLSLRLVNVQSR